MQKTKLMFSEAELHLVSNPDFILTKNQIIEKIYNLYGLMGERLFNQFKPLQARFPDELQRLPKISKGEKYKGMPWVMLDYPRNFSKDNGHLAIRVFFWWGHYFTLMAQFSGQYLFPVERGLRERKISHQILDYPIWAGYPKDIWDCSIPQPGLDLLSSNAFVNSVEKGDVLKLALKLPVSESQLLPAVVEKFSTELKDAFEKMN